MTSPLRDAESATAGVRPGGLQSAADVVYGRIGVSVAEARIIARDVVAAYLHAPQIGFVEVPDIKFVIADFLEFRDKMMRFVSSNSERSKSAIELHDAIQAIHAKIATAGVPVVRGRWAEYRRLLELVATKVNAQTTYEMASAYLDEAARTLDSEHDALISETDRLRHDNKMLTTGGIVEVAVRNPSVMDYMRHWEGRTEKAESALTAAQARIAELEGFADKAAGTCLGVAMSGKSHPDPDGALMGVFNAYQAIRATLSPVKENDRG